MITLAIDKATKTPYLVFRGTGTPPSELNFMFKPDLDLWARVYDPQVMGKILRYNLPCDGKLQEYHEAKMIEISPARIFEDTFRYEMLKGYQREGVAAALQVGSFLIADEMGLGKTPQAIAIASKLQARSLVICPTSLKHEWAAQITKFTEANSQIIEGSARDRASLWKAGLDCQFTIASYDILKNPNDLVGANDICNVGMVIFDEITRVKNSKTARAKAIAKLKARRILGLTGTPIENNLEEFYAILKLISPGLFPSFTVFADQYLIRKKMYVGSHSFLKTVGYKNLDLLKAQIAPYMIRRQRNEVLELPPSSTVIREVALSPFQRDIENLLFKCAKDNPDMVLRFFTFGLENMISPVLVPRDWSPDPDFEYEVELLEALLLLEDEGKDEAYTPRLEELALLLEDTDPYKVILFSKYLKALELANNTLGLKMNWLTGKSNVQNELKAWNNPSGPRLLAMTTAGAMGHNLQKNCNIMILMDQLFNPRLTDQLMARIYRMGQDKPVTYYVMDSNSVIEGKVKAIISNKDWLSKNVLEGAAAIAEKIHNGQLAAAVMFGGDYDDED